MPTVVTHALVGGVAVYVFPETQHRRRLWNAAILLSVLPDADVLGFRFGVAYGDFFGHRGFFHSPLFALLMALVCVELFFRHVQRFSTRWCRHVVFLFGVGASHGPLDALTDGGLGIALLSPFSDARYFWPWTPIPVSTIGLHDLWTGRCLPVLAAEALWVWLPLLLAAAIVRRAACRNGHKPDPSSDA